LTKTASLSENQVNFDPTLKGSDESTLTEYEEELKLYEEELVKQRRLKVVELFLREKEIRLERIREEIGWLGFGGGEFSFLLFYDTTQRLTRSLSKTRRTESSAATNYKPIAFSRFPLEIDRNASRYTSSRFDNTFLFLQSSQ